MAQNAIKVFEDRGLTPPAIIGVFHSSSKDDIHGRAKDLSPQSAFEGGVKPLITTDLKIEDLHGDWYQQLIAEKIVPTICDYLNFEAAFENSAMIGSSMGGLATLNALTLRPHFFRTALAFSPHWVLGGQPLVRHVLEQLPKPGAHKIWMSRGDRKLDSTYKSDQDFADRLMREQGWRNNYRSTVFKGAGHNERAWAKQVDDAFRFWLLD
jgi:predicted alpha/beta superfamily hydrolase